MGRKGKFSVVLNCAAVFLICFCLSSHAIAEEEPDGSILHLTNNDIIPGELQSSEDPGVLRWRSPWFTKPFDFPMQAVDSIHYQASAPPQTPKGSYCFEFVGDDVLYGDLLSLTETHVELESSQTGRIHVERNRIKRFYRWEGSGLIYLGPNGLKGWKNSSPTAQFRAEGGQLISDQPGASVFGDFGISEKVFLEFELSWNQKPNFEIAIGVNSGEVGKRNLFSLEVWGDHLVIVGESDKDADFVSIEKLGTEPGRAHVQVYLDQQQQRLLVFSRSGSLLKTLKLKSRKKTPVQAGLRLTNNKGDVRLERLRISRWNGSPPREASTDRSRLHQTDGSIIYGEITAFDPKSNQFTVRGEDGEEIFPADQIADIYLANASKRPLSSPSSENSDSAPTIRIVYRDGSRVSGRATRIEKTHLSMLSPGVKEPLRLPLKDLFSLSVLSKQSSTPPLLAAGRIGRLELEGVRLKGSLASGRQQADASCLAWHPELSLGASPLNHTASGQIIYRETKPKPAPPPQPNNPQMMMMGGFIQQALPQGGFGRVFKDLVKKKIPAQPMLAGQGKLHLRSGDTIACKVLHIDEKGVAFQTPILDATFVSNRQIKAVEISNSRGLPGLDKIKRQRLLTLPRLQRTSPPTHLICSKTGDVLRGRLVKMDSVTLQVEIRLEIRNIPRSRVAQIIWLHPDELDGKNLVLEAEPDPLETQVQARFQAGQQMTFYANRLDSNILSGQSELLGVCRADLAKVDRLLFGAQIGQEAAKLAFHQWRLHHATDPIFVQSGQDGSPGGHLAGTESPLVGQAAADFELELLDGEMFHLADRKGHVVVLDFWATWCGPCLQTMPVVDGVVREFADQDVELVAVNMEEQAKQITSTLKRHKLDVAVALDRDGVVAFKYAVTSIPQTVVIDRDGKVVRLFVGGGPKLAEPLRQAIQELLAEKTPPETSE